MDTSPGTSKDIENMEETVVEKKDSTKQRQKVNVLLCATGVILVIVIVVSLIMMGPLRPPPYDRGDSALANQKITIKLEESQDEVEIEGKVEIGHHSTTTSDHDVSVRIDGGTRAPRPSSG